MTFKCTLLFYYPQNSPPRQFCHFWHRPFQHALKRCIRPECQILVNSHLKQALHVWLQERSCPTFLDPTFNCNTIILWKRALGCCAFHQHSSVRSLEEKKNEGGKKIIILHAVAPLFFFPQSWPCQLQVSFKTAPAVQLPMTLLEQLLCLRNTCCLCLLHLFFILDQTE